MKTKLLLFILLFAVFFCACKKKETPIPATPNNPTPTPDTSLQACSDYALCVEYFTEMQLISNQASKGSVSSFKNIHNENILSSCAAVIFDTLNPADFDSIAVDFGSVNCLCGDGRYRRGKIYIVLQGGKKYWDSLTVATIATQSPNNYFVNDNQVNGPVYTTNKGHDSAGYLNWDVSIFGQIIKANSQDTIALAANFNNKWIAGESTALWMDDKHSITGSANGTSSDGNPFTVAITSALVKDISCRWFTAGTADITPAGKAIRHIDYGTSVCDNNMNITIGGNTYTVTLP